MEYASLLSSFGQAPTQEQIEQRIATIKEQTPKNSNLACYKTCFSCLDLTSLGITDSQSSIESFTQKVVDLRSTYPEAPQVASLCLYPIFVESAGLTAGDSQLAITSVAGGFPSSQTYLEVKMLEAAMAVENGADEIDVVLSIGELLDRNYNLLGGEIETLREELGEEIILKVILETGTLQSPELIYKAALIAMEAGADFIKTSTGKNGVGATPEAVVVMCQAIADYEAVRGRKVGIKVAGGVSTPEDAALYYTAVEQLLGEEYLNSNLFRIGASSLANALLSKITETEVNYF